MSNGTFPISMRDMRFILYEQLGIERLCQFDKFKDFSRETFDMVLEEGAKLAAEVIAPLNSIADKEGCVYEKGKVKVPEAFHDAFKKYCEGGWIAASVDAEAGGQGLPDSVALAAAEMFVGACCSFTTYPGLTRGCANLIESFGTSEQKALYLEKMYSGQWTGTMCLTEPQAGSAVGDVKTSAKKQGDHYLIQGTKIFITAGDHNLAENIIHAVLARTENAPPGTKGLSLFIVPKVRINADGSLGEPNDVNCGGIEHKMGLKGSSTCTLNFGDDGKCHGYILGQENQGIQLMFQMMNEARLGVGAAGFCPGEPGLPVCPEICQGTHPGRGSYQDERPQCAPGSDHQTSRRSPDAHDHESLCRRSAGADLPQRLLRGFGQGGHGPEGEGVLREHD